jgi:hypothetical protein
VFANRYTALIDACTLVSVWRRNLLLSLAEAEFFRIRWSEPILNETKAALIKMARERDLDDPEARGVRAVKAMQTAFPEAMVEDFELIGSAQFGLPDGGDEHVIAAAVKTQAQALVTENRKIFQLPSSASSTSRHEAPMTSLPTLLPLKRGGRSPLSGKCGSA